ncbi:MAG: FAD-binding oxidoreductase [Bacteroidota bacterium]|nr:FAD-binding oxidoreductase [Bacteroidota bacterium]
MSWGDYLSWGRYPRHRPAAVWRLRWRGDPLPAVPAGMTLLPRGYGRSYGDSCLNDRGILLDATGLDHFIALDEENGILRCEAGVSIGQVLRLIVPRGFFVPVSPGTQWVSIGGAIANDVHGKNHHRSGSFGCHVRAFELVRSTGERFLCTPTQAPQLFRATIGGLGLTGLITWAEIQLRRVETAWMETELIPFTHVREFFRLSRESDVAFEYTVAWADVTARGKHLGRGIFWRGNHARREIAPPTLPPVGLTIRVPMDVPSWLLNPWSARSLNALYYWFQRRQPRLQVVPYETFFYPLDAVGAWNRLYGIRGFVQYQCVVPPAVAEGVVEELLERISRARVTAFLGVLKVFGERRSPGMLSFPRPGVTLAVDFALEGEGTWRLLQSLDACVRKAGGALYPAKDARMSPEMFELSFPCWSEFARFRDPAFSSSFWRRVTEKR